LFVENWISAGAKPVMTGLFLLIAETWSRSSLVSVPHTSVRTTHLLSSAHPFVGARGKKLEGVHLKHPTPLPTQ